MISPHAAMAELVDALDSGSSRGNSVELRLFLAANNQGFGCRQWRPTLFSSFVAPAKSARHPRCCRWWGTYLLELPALSLRFSSGIGLGFQETHCGSSGTRQVHTSDQNKSDLEKTLKYVFAEGAQTITVYERLGKRLDHTLTNLSSFAGILIKI